MAGATPSLVEKVDSLASAIGADQLRQDKLINKLLPADAASLHGQALNIYAGTTVKFTGYLSNDAAAAYKAGSGAGTQVPYIINDAIFTLETPSTANAINAGDQGALNLKINGTQVDTFDLAARYNPANEAAQTWTPANSAGGKITVTSVALYNAVWQKLNARINISSSDLRRGFNTITLTHTSSGGLNQISQDFEVFYDTAATTPIVAVPVVSAGTATNAKWLSGIKHLGLNDQVAVSVVGSNLFDNTYVLDPITLSGLAGVPAVTVAPTDSAVSGLSSPPKTGEVMTVTNRVLLLNSASQASINARVTAQPRDPFGYGTAQQSGAQNLMINTFGVTATATAEYFDDETYRLPLTWAAQDTAAAGAALTGNWNSQTALANGNAQQAVASANDNGLTYPSINYASGYVPTQSANYSGRTGDQKYMRAFQTSGAKSSIVLTLGGLAGGINQVGSGDVNVEVKLPGQTGWLDAAKPYNGIAATADGDGCLFGSITYGSGAVLNLTFGTKSSFGSANRILVRLTLRNTNRVITSLLTNW